MSRLKELEAEAIHYLKAFEPKDERGYYLCYSGGKDSDTIKILAQLAGVKYEAHHNLTTVDAPETVYYVKSQKDVIIDLPEKTMWQLIPENLMPPTRLVRYCCSALKERGGVGQLKITGVRKFESVRRAKNSGLIQIMGKPKDTIKLAAEMSMDVAMSEKGSIVLNLDNDPERRLVEQCYRTRNTVVNPIIEWTDTDVWEFLHHYGCASNPLYQCGRDRVGCILCPMEKYRDKLRDEEQYPRYKKNYIRAFEKMLERRRQRGLVYTTHDWQTGEEVFDWWLGRIHGQMTLDEFFPDGLTDEPDVDYLGV